MKRTKFTESQIIGILKEQEQGKKLADLCREHGISQLTFYQWKSKYSGKRIKELEGASMKNYTYFILTAFALDIVFTLIACRLIDISLKAIYIKAAVVSVMLILVMLLGYYLKIGGTKFLILSLLFSYSFLAIFTFIASTSGRNFIQVFSDSHFNEAFLYIYLPSVLSQLLSYFILRMLP